MQTAIREKEQFISNKLFRILYISIIFSPPIILYSAKTNWQNSLLELLLTGVLLFYIHGEKDIGLFSIALMKVIALITNAIGTVVVLRCDTFSFTFLPSQPLKAKIIDNFRIEIKSNNYSYGKVGWAITKWSAIVKSPILQNNNLIVHKMKNSTFWVRQ